MITKPDHILTILDFFKKQRSQNEEKKFVIFTSTEDVDSVCAATIFQNLLHREDIVYTIIPVANYDQVATELQQITDICSQADTLYIFYVNLGANVFVRDLLSEGADCQVINLVIDAHRPIAHKYNDADGPFDIFVLDDSDQTAADSIPVAHDPADDESGSDEEDGSDGEQDDRAAASPGVSSSSSQDENAPPGKRRERDAGEPSSSKRTRLRRERRPDANQREAMRRERERQLSSYYSQGAGYGKPAAMVLYESLEGLRLQTTAEVWYAAVGLTDQFLHQRVDAEKYLYWLEQIEAAAAAVQDDGGGRIGGEDPNVVILEEGNTTVAKPVDNMRVRQLDDYRFFLGRHWTLYDSIKYSPYIAPRLQTWRELGQGNIDFLLVKFGIPKRISQEATRGRPQRWYSDLVSKLREHGANLGIDIQHLGFKSFELQRGHELFLGAADVVHALSALLAQPALDSPRRIGNFSAATDALQVGNWQRLQDGIQAAKVLQKAVIGDGGLAIARRHVEHLSAPRATFIRLSLEEHLGQHREFFQQPLPCLWMASFLRDAIAIASGGRAKPVVVVGTADNDGFCYVVGIRHKIAGNGQLQANIFGDSFHEAIEQMSGDKRVQQNGFDNAIVRVHRADVQRFLTALQLVMHVDVPDPKKTPPPPPPPQQQQQQQALQALQAEAS